ncbi:17047_t:CDS:10 [Funneliformis caledonium]|uniref:17047_t:CDS:1 n=1 Tax=Funneliformis caledonium TaxID=1117310 RepID=A0A9N9I266_9GLOM|nr:17047_t:CDS:10 [Funneliformis caledonium]
MTHSAPYGKPKCLGSGGSMVARLKLKGIDGRAPPGLFLDSMGGGAWPFLVGGVVSFLEGLSVFNRWKFEAITDMGNLLKLHRDGDRALQLLLFNEESLVSTSHQLVLITSFNRHLFAEKLVKLGHLEEVKVVTRFPVIASELSRLSMSKWLKIHPSGSFVYDTQLLTSNQDPKDGELCLNRAKPEETLVEARSGSDVQIDRRIWWAIFDTTKGVSSSRQQDGGHGSWNPLRSVKVRYKALRVILSGTTFSADLGVSSKYSNENFED